MLVDSESFLGPLAGLCAFLCSGVSASRMQCWRLLAVLGVALTRVCHAEGM